MIFHFRLWYCMACAHLLWDWFSPISRSECARVFVSRLQTWITVFKLIVCRFMVVNVACISWKDCFFILPTSIIQYVPHKLSVPHLMIQNRIFKDILNFIYHCITVFYFNLILFFFLRYNKSYFSSHIFKCYC